MDCHQITFVSFNVYLILRGHHTRIKGFLASHYVDLLMPSRSHKGFSCTVFM